MLDCPIDNSFCHQINGRIGSSVGIDDRGSDDTFLVKTSSGTARKIFATGSGTTIQHAGVPKLSPGIGIDGIDRIGLGSNVDDIVSALTGNIHVGHVEGLSHHHIVDGSTEEVTKAVLVDVGGG